MIEKGRGRDGVVRRGLGPVLFLSGLMLIEGLVLKIFKLFSGERKTIFLQKAKRKVSCVEYVVASQDF